MIFKRYEWRIVLRVSILFITLLATSFVVVKELYMYLIICLPLVAAELLDFLRFQKKAQNEVEQFAESVHYRDFSRHFDVGRAPLELKPLRKGFNDINSTFKLISR